MDRQPPPQPEFDLTSTATTHPARHPTDVVPMPGDMRAAQGRRLATLVLFVSVAALSVFGIVMLYSATSPMYREELLIRQAVWIGIGMVMALGLWQIEYRHLTNYRHVIILVALLPLFYLAAAHVLVRLNVVSVEFVSGLPFLGHGAIKGAYRWLYIGSRSVQPSEFAKLAIILYVAGYYGSDPRCVESFRKGVFKPMVVIGTVVLAIF